MKVNTKKATRAVVVAGVGVVGVLALVGCSTVASNQTQPQVMRAAAEVPAESPVNTQPKANPTGIHIDGKDKGVLKDVTITGNDQVSCHTANVNTATKAIFFCNGIETNLFGDPLWVGVPDGSYRLYFEEAYHYGNNTMATYLRNWAHVEMASSHAERVTWNIPASSKVHPPHNWGVGVSGHLGGQVAVYVTVTRV